MTKLGRSLQGRRAILLGAIGGGVALSAPRAGVSAIEPKRCVSEPTSSDVEGPFFRAAAPKRAVLRTAGAKDPLDVVGEILDARTCRPVRNARINVWQASPSAEYDLTGALAYHGFQRSDHAGRYHFKTSVPPPYTDGGLARPAHIHFKVVAPGFETLTTQMYFAGDGRLATDPFVKKTDGYSRVVTPRAKADGILQAEFTIRLAPV